MHDDDDELDDSDRTPIAVDARAAWQEASAAGRIARAARRELRERGIHLFGAPHVHKPNPADPGRLGRLELRVIALEGQLGEVRAEVKRHGEWIERIDRVQFKILAAAALGGGAVAAAIQLVRWALTK
jgi:hypothetical protein